MLGNAGNAGNAEIAEKQNQMLVNFFLMYDKVLIGIIRHNMNNIYWLGYNRFFRVAIINLYRFYIN